MSSAALSRGARGGRVTLIGQILKAVVSMVSVVVLSRLLLPGDFGLIAMVTVVVSLGELLRDFGLSTAGLRARTLSHAQGSNLFWINTGLGTVAAALVAASAPLLAHFYNEPRLVAITPVIATTLLLNGAQAQVQVQMARSGRYTALVLTDLASQIVGFLAALVGIWLGAGYWALVAQPIALAVTLLVSRFVISRWIPMRPSRGSNSKQLIVSGADFGVAYGLTFAANNTDTIMIGALWGATSLGLYNRAYQLLTMPINRLMAPMMNVVVPTINAVREAGGNVQREFLRIQSLVGIGSTLIFVLAAACADPLIPLLLDDEWIGAIPLFQILAIGGLALGFSQVSYWIFVTEGKSRELLKYNLVTKTMTVAMVIGGSFISVEGAAWAYAAALLISWPINVIWLARTAGIDGPKFLLNGFRIIGSGLAAGMIVKFMPWGVVDQWLLLGVEAIVATVLFFLFIAIFPSGRRDFATIKRLPAALRRAG